jgi:hypothetical protein
LVSHICFSWLLFVFASTGAGEFIAYETFDFVFIEAAMQRFFENHAEPAAD